MTNPCASRGQARTPHFAPGAIQGIEEVNMFKEDGTVTHFSAPKVQASVAANTYVVTGHAENKRLEELLPGIINQLGPDNLANLKRIAEGYANASGASKDAGGSKEG